MIDDRDRDLGTVLSYLVGRPVRTVELAKALGVARSSYYAARDEGRLISADNLLRLADVFGLNPVDLLVRYGLVSHEAAAEYARDAGVAPAKPGTAEPGNHPLKSEIRLGHNRDSRYGCQRHRHQ